ncbi:MAG: helix-turn-helix transcriptional regulator [Geminicoccaceae bacterium]|nr:helix-turn-helix transcriptional regulator [Geminicoccaceae bacterium]
MGETGRGPLVEVVGCKWSVEVLCAVRRGVRRPGALEWAIPGISTKVLNERLSKLCRLGLLSRTAWPEVPPRVEYDLTEAGMRLCAILDDLAALEAELAADAGAAQEAPTGAGSGTREPSP